MTTYSVRREDVAYAPAADMLYIAQNGGTLEACDEIEDIWSQGITVMMTGGAVSGIEIYDFTKTYGNPPLAIYVESRNPFKLEIPFALS